MTIPTNQLLRGDCLEILPTLPEASVQLVITSPPYNCGWDYAGTKNDRLPMDEYLGLLQSTLDQLQRVLRPGGVLALNLPPTIRPPRRGTPDPTEVRSFPLAGWAQLELERRGWLLRESIAWVKSKGDVEVRATSTAIGAHSNPFLRACHEMIIVASKGTYRIPEREARWPGDRSAFVDYLELCKDVWPMKPGRAKAGEPLAFPDDLAARLLTLYSNPGDVVLDPFAGSGTTGRVALLHGRVAWLIEREPSYWPRLEAAIGQGVLVVA